jgi:hypothetical protein
VLPHSPCSTPQLRRADARRTPLPIAHVNRRRRVSNTNALCLLCEPFIMLRCLVGPLAPAGPRVGPYRAASRATEPPSASRPIPVTVPPAGACCEHPAHLHPAWLKQANPDAGSVMPRSARPLPIVARCSAGQGAAWRRRTRVKRGATAGDDPALRAVPAKDCKAGTRRSIPAEQEDELCCHCLQLAQCPVGQLRLVSFRRRVTTGPGFQARSGSDLVFNDVSNCSSTSPR